MCEEISGIKGLGTGKKKEKRNHQNALAHFAACLESLNNILVKIILQ